jgi:ParB family chromosome partitioning protein
MTIQYIPLSALQADTGNVRKTFNPASIEELAQSILTDGLLQNLVVAKPKGRKKRYRIISGERRYRALKLLFERGDLSDAFEVPVEIRGGLSEVDTRRLATVENVQRENLPPLEEAEAVAGLIQDGQTLADVAAQTGLSLNTIKRRLALVNLTDAVKTALSNGTLTLGQAEALTLGSPEEQRHILERLEDGYYYEPDHIRDIIVDAKPSLALAIFPKEAYAGTFTTDLFGEDDTTYFDDAAQFFALQRQAVDALAQRHAETAAWVEVTEDYSISKWQYDQAEEGETGGVIINLSPTGHVSVAEGLVKRGEIDPETAEGSRDNPLAPKQPKPAYSQPVREYMAMHKSVAVQHRLLANPRKAKEVALTAMMGASDWLQPLQPQPHGSLRYFNLEANHSPVYDQIEAAAADMLALIGLNAEEGVPAWASLITHRKDEVATYEAVKALSDEQLDTLFTVITALTFGQGDATALDTRDSLFNRVAGDLEIDMRRHWKPDDAFLTRRSKPQLIGIAHASGATGYTVGIETYKKGELVKVIRSHFKNAYEAGEPNDYQQKALAWLPEAMRFPAVDPDAQQPEDAAGETVADAA